MLLRILLLLTLPLSLLLPHTGKAQIIAVNDGAEIRVEGGLIVGVQGGFWNRDGVIYNSDTLYIGDTIRNDDAAGMFATQLPSGTPTNGTVVMDNTFYPAPNTDQFITGDSAVFFQTVRMRGTGLKELVGVDTYIRDTLDLGDREFDLDINNAFVITPAVEAIQWLDDGFVSSDTSVTQDGYLHRSMANNTTQPYTFPVGDRNLAIPVRPAYIQPSVNAADTFAVRLGFYDPVFDGFPTDSVDQDICQVNNLYYHNIQRFGTVNAGIDLTLFYDPGNDPINQLMATWQNVPHWESLGGNTAGFALPGLQNRFASGITNFGFGAFAFADPKPPVSLDPLNSPYCTNQAQDTARALPGGAGSTYIITDLATGNIVYQGPDSIIDPAAIGAGEYELSYVFQFTNPATCLSDTVSTTFVINQAPDISGLDVVCSDAPNETYINTSDSSGSWNLVSDPGINSVLANTTATTAEVNFGVTTTGNFTDSLFFTDLNGCADTFTVDVNPSPEITAGPTDVCGGSSATYSGTTATGAEVWSIVSNIGSTINPPGGQATFGTPPNPAQDIIILTYGNGCDDSLTVDVVPTPTPAIVQAAPPLPTVCIGGSIDLEAQPTSGGGFTYDYTWSTIDAPGSNPAVPGLPAPVGAQTTTFDAGLPGGLVQPGVYTVQLVVTEDVLGCADSTTVEVTVNDLPAPNITPQSPTVCLGDDAVFSGDDPNFEYFWNGGNTNQNPFSITTTAVGPLEVSVTAVDPATGCQASFDPAAAVDVVPNPVVSISVPPTDFCEGNPVTITASANTTAPYQFNWLQDGAGTGITAADFDVTTSGSYTAEVTDANGCEGSATEDIQTILEPQVTISSNDDDNIVCEGETITFTANVAGASPNEMLYTWTITNFDGSETQISGQDQVTVSGGTQVSLEAFYTRCPNFTFSYLTPVDFTVNPRPQGDFTWSPDTIFLSQPITFEAEATDTTGTITGLAYNWDFNNDNSPDFSSENTTAEWQYDNAGRKIVSLEIVPQPGECSITLTDTLNVFDVGINVPSAYSPNGDGLNDFMEVWTRGVDPSTFEMIIFDRWGNVVTRLNGDFLNQRNNGWDGTTDGGEPVSEGVYVYKIDACGYTDRAGECISFDRAGTVTVLR